MGDGPEKEHIENIIKERKINSVKLLGFQDNPYAYMKKADVFVCPSFFEGYSTVVAEAQALGIPVLTTDCAGMREILDNGECGLIVKNSDDGIKSGLISLFEDKQIYMNIKKNSESKKERLSTVLYNLMESIRIATVYLQAYLPDTADSIFDQINTNIRTYDSVFEFGGYDSGTKVNPASVLFQRIEK